MDYRQEHLEGRSRGRRAPKQAGRCQGHLSRSRHDARACGCRGGSHDPGGPQSRFDNAGQLSRGSKTFNELTPSPDATPIDIEISTQTWHTLRVKAVGSTLSLYFDSVLLGQFHSPEV